MSESTPQTLCQLEGDEVWLPVPGYEGWYEVSSLGRVRSVDRLIVDRRGHRVWHRGQVLKQCPNHLGYLVVYLSRNSVKRTVAVHRLVAVAFLGPSPEGQEVRHGSNGQTDNRASQLCYGTKLENMADMRRDGTHAMANREVCPLGHALASPNLVPYFERRGHRNCLACDRGRGTVRNNRRRGIELDLQTVSDEHHARIVAGEAPPRQRRSSVRRTA